MSTISLNFNTFMKVVSVYCKNSMARTLMKQVVLFFDISSKVFFNSDYHYHKFESFHKLQQYKCGVLLNKPLKAEINSSGYNLVVHNASPKKQEKDDCEFKPIRTQSLNVPNQFEARRIQQDIQENRAKREQQEKEQKLKSQLQLMKLSMGPYKINNTKPIIQKEKNIDESVITPLTPISPFTNSPSPINQLIRNQLQGISVKLINNK